MKISGISISSAEILNVTNSSVLFANNTATVGTINIHFKSDKYTDTVSGTISIDRIEAKKLIKQLNDQLKIRTGNQHIIWSKRKRKEANEKIPQSKDRKG